MEESQLQSYISRSKDANSHFSKAHYFLRFVEEVFEEEIEIDRAKEIFPELEKYLV